MKRLFVGLLILLVGMAVGMTTIYFLREPARTTVDPIVVETQEDSEDARAGKKNGSRSDGSRNRRRPAGPREDHSGGGAVPVQPAPPAAGDDEDDFDDDGVGDDDNDDDEGAGD